MILIIEIFQGVCLHMSQLELELVWLFILHYV